MIQQISVHVAAGTLPSNLTWWPGHVRLLMTIDGKIKKKNSWWVLKHLPTRKKMLQKIYHFLFHVMV